jgi:multicomponent Na+:H+ antiporter subunit D
MTWEELLPILVVFSSLLPGILIFFLREDQEALRTVLNLAGAVLKLILVAVMLWSVARFRVLEVRYHLVGDVDFVLHADAFSLLFVTLSAVLWLLTTIYAIAYLKGSAHRQRFFGFFGLCVSATTGIALSGNLLTLLIFYEALTLATYPLVVHRGTPEALEGGRVYLTYTISGGAVLLLAMVWLTSLVGGTDFVEGGYLADADPALRGRLQIIFAMMCVGFGVKAALVPLHGWLPKAMVAPAPVSALLHAVAVVKAGAFGIVRVVYDVYGVEFCSVLGVAVPLAIAASITILFGSIRALYQDDLKRRLAYSTVSQVSYIVLGAAVVGPLSTIGSVVHLVHQGVMKITLFFAAGCIAETVHLKSVSELNGIGRRMPLTMAAFTIAALGMIGIPPTAGFISKWFLIRGAIEAEQPWVVLVLVTSTLLNAAYFLPIIYAAWFKEPHCSHAGAGGKSADSGSGPAGQEGHQEEIGHTRLEARAGLLFPMLITAALTLLVGVLAGLPFSPLDWAKLVVEREYRS